MLLGNRSHDADVSWRGEDRCLFAHVLDVKLDETSSEPKDYQFTKWLISHKVRP